MHEGACSILGGHSVADDEIKFGYAVTGTVHPARVKANAGARAGDALVFTKRIGTGVISTALKRGIAQRGARRRVMESMLALNRRACEEMLRFDVHGCTDITGFGLIGHAREMAAGSGVTLEIAAGRVRFLPGRGRVRAARGDSREASRTTGNLPAAPSDPPRLARDRRPALRSADLRRIADFAAGKRMPPRWSARFRMHTESAAY